MTSCSQNRHATELRYISYIKKKEAGFEPAIGKNPTDLQSATLNRSVILSLNKSYFKTNLLVRSLIFLNFLGLQPL